MTDFGSKSPQKDKFRPQKTQFWEEFDAEFDIFDSATDVPAWIFGYRENLLRKIQPEL